MARTVLLAAGSPSPSVSPGAASGLETAINSTTAIVLIVLTSITAVAALLGPLLKGLRSWLAHAGVLKKWKHADWIYGKYDRALLFRVLDDLGYRGEPAQKAAVRRMIDAGKPKKASLTVHRRKLTVLIRQIMSYSEGGRYGNTPSDYYINTMGACRNDEYMKTMTKALAFMIDRMEDKRPDFILTPKSGNPLLGRSVAKEYDIPYVFKKYESDKSMARGDNIDPNIMLNIEFEGFEGFIEAVQGKKGLRGVIVDCNLSGGSQILKAAERFNELVIEAGLDVDPIRNVYVLFRVDNEHGDIDDIFKGNQLALHRYFDLNEGIKADIYRSISKCGNQNVYSDSPGKPLNKFLEKHEGMINFSQEDKDTP